MKYKLLGNNDYRVNPLETVLKNRGIEDIDKFLNLDESVVHDWRLLDNIDKAVDCLLKHLEKGSKIHMQVDVDVDGVTSSATMANYLYRIKPDINIHFHMNKGKVHGIFAENVPEDVGLVIVPDAGTNDFDSHRKLHERGIDIIVNDHHHLNEGNDLSETPAIVVNNQTCDYPNKDLSGVGIVYKFCKALDERLGVNYADDYLDLVATGLISDSMSMASLETRYYVLEGLQDKKIKNPLIKAIIEKQAFNIKDEITIKTVGWNIAPFINAVIRVGTEEERYNLFKAMLENCTDTLPYKKRGTTEEIQEPLAVAMARISANVKARQGRMRDKGVELLEQRIKERGLDKNKVLIVNATGLLDKGLTGLVAIQLAEKYQKPTLILQQNEDSPNEFLGSARNFNNSPIENLRGFISDLELFNFASGHFSAFGIGIDAERLLEANYKMNLLLEKVDFTKQYLVDFELPARDLTGEFVKSIAKYNNIWGKGCEEPKIAVKDILLNKSEINIMGKSEDTVKFIINGVEFIKFKTPNFLDSVPYNDIKMTVIGTCDLNEWAGRTTPQFKIEDWKIEEDKNAIFSRF